MKTLPLRSSSPPLLLGWALALLMAACSNSPPKISTLDIEADGETVSAEVAVVDPAVETEAVVKFGVLAIDSAVSVNERYSALMNYLTEATGQRFQLVPLTQDSQFEQVAADALDFTTNNPLAAVQIRRLYDTEFLVTHSRPQTGSQFSGLIIVRDDSPINTLEELRGKRVACVDFQTAAAGCVFQIQHLLDAGIDPFTEFDSFAENKSQDNIVFAVLNGTLDAGFIRTGQLEKMIARGILDSQAELRVLEPANDDFYYEHTTALYPEWPIAALADTDPDLVEAVQAALLTIPPDHPALTAAKVDGFVAVADYASVDRLIETLQLKSWDAP